MDTETVLMTLGNALLIVGVVTIGAFGAHYSLSAPWWKSAVGWMFVLVSFAVTAFGATVILGTFLGPDYPGRSIVRVVGYAFFALAGVVLLVTYLSERKRPDPALPVITGAPVFVPPLVRLWRAIRARKASPTPPGPKDHTLVS